MSFPPKIVTTPQVFTPSTDFTKARLCGTAISAVAYGIVVSLSVTCLRLLVRSKHIYAKIMRLLLLIYVVTMLTLSTVSIGVEFAYMETITFQPSHLPGVTNNGKLLFVNDIPLTIPLAIWGADGFMVCTPLKLYALCY